MAMEKLKRVLSIQSHVVSGYVGNKSATFPLQVLGFDVDAMNSVQLSNHTGYKSIQGQVLQAEELKVLFNGLKENEIDIYSHFLTGYCGSESFLKEIVNVLKHLKLRNPNITYVCDPVMGDDGEFYVPESLLPIYRDELVPLADILTPNQFEAELLTGMKIKTESDACKALKLLHSKGIKTVILTSTCLENEGSLVLLASQHDKKGHYIRLPVPRLDETFTGTGDLFASMLLAWLHAHPGNLKLACEKTMSAMQAVLKKTLMEANALAGEVKKPSVAQKELRLVQSLDIIRNPEVTFTAEIRTFT